MNLMGGRLQRVDEKYRLAGGGGGGGGGGLSSSSSSSSSSSPTAHHELGGSFPLSYYSSSSNYASLRDMEMMRAGLLGRGNHVGQEQEEEEEHRGSGMMIQVEKEHMFDKVVTPSDVGKLNRLVIPKQHAEKYFPLDSSANEKGLLLNFEDRNGKPWRFRYSYWNSSQSYVMTKGWSRFVKEKKLDAGDIVSFQRGMGDSVKDRLFIDWTRRPDAPSPPPYWTHYPPPPPPHPYYFHPPPPGMIHHMGSRLGNPRPPLYHEHHHHQHHVLVNRSGRAAGMGMGMGMGVVFESVPVVQGKAAAKRMRLFGVNISTDSEDEANILSSTALPVPPSAGAATDRLGLFLSNSGSSNRPACSSSSMSLDLDI